LICLSSSVGIKPKISILSTRLGCDRCHSASLKLTAALLFPLSGMGTAFGLEVGFNIAREFLPRKSITNLPNNSWGETPTDLPKETARPKACCARLAGGRRPKLRQPMNSDIHLPGSKQRHSIIRANDFGTYTVNGDCTGRIISSAGGGTFEFVTVDAGKESYFVQTDPSAGVFVSKKCGQESSFNHDR
jgi:hypothetical protein